MSICLADRNSRSEGLDQLPTNYSKLSPALPPDGPELGPPLPGDVIATVTEPVYDTATGRFLLISQGSPMLGPYNSQVSDVQSRVQVVWNRIILPDTSSLTLDNLVGSDPAGYAGLEDGVDWHGDRIINAGRDSAQDSINQVGQEMTRRNMNVQPTLTSRPGLPVRIIVNRDVVLRPYQPLFFNRGTSR